MSINSAHCNDGISIYADERIIFRKNEVYLKFKGSNLPESMRKEARGAMYLTQFRMIFLSEKCKGPLKSFSFPFHSISDLDIKQPLFGANYITALVLAEIDGGFEGSASFDLTFKDGGAIDFGKLLFKTVKQCQAQPRWVPTGPPSYFDVMAGEMGYPGPGYPSTSGGAGPPGYSSADAPPPAYGFNPNAAGGSGAAGYAQPPPAYYSADNPNTAMMPNGGASSSHNHDPSAPPPCYEFADGAKKDN